MAAEPSESYVRYVKHAESVAQVGFFSTTLFCFTLIFLTLFGVKRNFGSYTYLLVLFPVVGIFFATIELILYPNVYSHNAGYVFYSSSRPFKMEKEVVTWFLAFYTGVYASTISMLSVQFLYRFWAIFDETKLRFFKGWRFLICIMYSVFFGIQWALGIYYFDAIDEYSKSYLKEEMLKRYDTDIAEISGMTLVAYDENGYVRWFNVSCTLNMTLIMLIQYTVIIYCAVFMYRGMEEKLRMLSFSLRSLHKQFFKTLILQIVTPTITLFSPVMLIIYLPLLDLETDLPTGIFLCAFTLYPAMDALIVMYIVRDYRRAARNILKKFLEQLHSWLSTDKDYAVSQTKSIAANIPAAMNNL
uniref:Seven TM Receptor n=1 Tax=Caenorhabditis tropicalis TaxID=1561998 RepID=A0A1I7U848_9PELO